MKITKSNISGNCRRAAMSGAFAALAMLGAPAAGAFSLDWHATTTVNVGTGDFAPSLMMANRAGTLSQARGVYERAYIGHRLEPEKRFSYSFGIDAYAQCVSAVDYRRWDPVRSQFTWEGRRPAWATLQQLFGEIKYRSLYLMVGMKEHDRSFVQNPLASGDLTISNNARPIPQGRIGFYDFVDIPLTQGWVQIIGDIAYGKFTDGKWVRDHYNYYNSFITTGNWYHYKRLYLRSNPSQPFSATVGMQHAAQFGGTVRRYRDGKMYVEYHNKVTFRDFLDVFVQKQFNNSDIAGESMNFKGNHLGSWDVKFRYRFRNADELTFYVQKPWEDGTGIGWQNGFDGVWGLEYRFSNSPVLKSAVVEYLDFTNQAGPFLHEPSADIPSNPTGADDYYNNHMYNGWANYGMSIGSPVLRSPIFNTNGYMQFLDNAVRGFHMGVDGTYRNLDWKVLLSWKQSKGTHYYPRPERRSSTSMMIGADYRLPSVNGLKFNAQAGFDAGKLYKSCFGMLVSVTYEGRIDFKK